MRRQKSPKFDFQSQFSMSKISFIILIFVSVKIVRLGEQLIISCSTNLINKTETKIKMMKLIFDLT